MLISWVFFWRNKKRREALLEERGCGSVGGVMEQRLDSRPTDEVTGTRLAVGFWGSKVSLTKSPYAIVAYKYGSKVAFSVQRLPVLPLMS